MKKIGLVAASLLLSVSADAQGWVDVSDPNNTPGTTNRSGMCYYQPGGYCLLVRGTETWTYTGTQGWAQLSPATPPLPAASTGTPAVYESDITFSASTGRCVLAQSYREYQPNSYRAKIAIFEWDGTDWNPGPILATFGTAGNQFSPHIAAISASPNSPDIYLLTNGSSSLSGVRTWRISQSTSTLMGTADPVTTLVKPVINNGSGQRFELHTDPASNTISAVISDPPGLWQFDAVSQNWSQCFPSYLGHPITSGDFGPIAFSDTNNVGIGLGVDLPYTTRTLEYSGCDIGIQYLPSQPAVRTGYAIAYDSNRSRFVLHGGSGYADTWELELGPLASYSTTGTGCVGTGGTPTLQAANGTLPVAGSQFNVQVSGMPWNTFSFMFLGTQNASYAGVPLPFDLAPVGAPGCVLRTPGTYLYGFPNVLGTGLWTYNVPYLPGQTFYNQAIIFDPTANSLGLTVSNVGEATIGS